jgi:hypothetical protein
MILALDVPKLTEIFVGPSNIIKAIHGNYLNFIAITSHTQ